MVSNCGPHVWLPSCYSRHVHSRCNSPPWCHKSYDSFVKMVVVIHTILACVVKQLKGRDSSKSCNTSVDVDPSRIIFSQARCVWLTNLFELLMVNLYMTHTHAIEQIPKGRDRV